MTLKPVPPLLLKNASAKPITHIYSVRRLGYRKFTADESET